MARIFKTASPADVLTLRTFVSKVNDVATNSTGAIHLSPKGLHLTVRSKWDWMMALQLTPGEGSSWPDARSMMVAINMTELASALNTDVLSLTIVVTEDEDDERVVSFVASLQDDCAFTFLPTSHVGGDMVNDNTSTLDKVRTRAEALGHQFQLSKAQFGALVHFHNMNGAVLMTLTSEPGRLTAKGRHRDKKAELSIVRADINPPPVGSGVSIRLKDKFMTCMKALVLADDTVVTVHFSSAMVAFSTPSCFVALPADGKQLHEESAEGGDDAAELSTILRLLSAMSRTT